MLRVELPGREFVSLLEAVIGRGRSREAGRMGGSMRVSRSVDLDLINEALERLAGCTYASPVVFVVLLRARQTEATFDSDSDLLFSRFGAPKPNFLRRDEALELKEPVLTVRSLFSEPETDRVIWLSPIWTVGAPDLEG